MHITSKIVAAILLTAALASTRTALASEPSETTANPDKTESTSDENASSGMVGTLSFAGVRQLGQVADTRSVSPAGGGALFFSVGYMWSYVGFDVLGGAGIDVADRRTTEPDGTTRDSTIERGSSVAALRLRGGFKASPFRLAVAAGPGIVYRATGVSSGAGIPEQLAVHRSLAFTADLSAQVMVGQTTSLSLGAMLWLEGRGEELMRAGDVYAANAPQATGMTYLGFQWGP